MRRTYFIFIFLISVSCMQNFYLPEGPMVSADWLKSHIDHKDLLIIEAKLKPIGAQDDWESGFKIPNAVQMDINADFSDLNTDLPHMLPSVAEFELAARSIGIKNESIIVVYDQVGVYASPRARWMLKAMGHNKVYILDGGIKEWQAAGYDIVKAEWEKTNSGDFIAKLNPSLIYDAQKMLSIIGSDQHSIWDARSQGRFDGTAPEPRPGLRGGHIPGSQCLPFQYVQNGHKMRTKEELEKIFADSSLQNKSLVMTCGSGVTASIIALSAEIAGHENVAVYDGSWAEWGMPSELPVEKK